MYIVLALLCMVLGAVQDILSKEVANKEIKSETMFINTYLFLGIFRVLLIAITVGGAFVFRPIIILFLIPNALVSALSTYLYIKAVKKLPVSVVAPLYLIYYPLSMIFSIGILNESVTIIQLIAMVVIFVLILMLSIDTSKSRLNKGINNEHYEESHKKLAIHLGSISKGIIYIISAGLLKGIVILLDKNAYNAGVTIDEMILYGGIFSIIIAFIFYGVIKKTYDIKGSKYIYIMTPLMLITIGVKFFESITYISAMKMGNATVVIPIVASSILLIELLSSLFLKERLKKFDYACIVIFFIAILILTK